MTRTASRLLLSLSLSLVPALAAAQAPPTPTAGPEHAVLKEDVGSWDASVEMLMPGAPATPPSKGVEVNVMSCNGLCLVTDFKGEIMGGPFQGHGVTTWDPSKKAYTGSWSDSMAAGLATTEGTWDAAKKTLTSTMLTPDGNGGTVKMRSTVEYSAGKRVFSMYMPGPDGKDVPSMRITYTRQKK
ncbi:MAG: DUF1579 domain-containing protein [Vicinamibacteraceae bacterium]